MEGCGELAGKPHTQHQHSRAGAATIAMRRGDPTSAVSPGRAAHCGLRWPGGETSLNHSVLYQTPHFQQSSRGCYLYHQKAARITQQFSARAIGKLKMSDQTAVSPAGTKFLLRRRKLLAAGREKLHYKRTLLMAGVEAAKVVSLYYLPGRPHSLQPTGLLKISFSTVCFKSSYISSTPMFWATINIYPSPSPGLPILWRRATMAAGL